MSEGEEVTVERFVEKWGEKGYKGGSLDRLFYFYSCFGPGGENEVIFIIIIIFLKPIYSFIIISLMSLNIIFFYYFRHF